MNENYYLYRTILFIDSWSCVDYNKCAHITKIRTNPHQSRTGIWASLINFRAFMSEYIEEKKERKKLKYLLNLCSGFFELYKNGINSKSFHWSNQVLNIFSSIFYCFVFHWIMLLLIYYCILFCVHLQREKRVKMQQPRYSPALPTAGLRPPMSRPNNPFSNVSVTKCLVICFF